MIQQLDKMVYTGGYMKRAYWYYSFLGVYIMLGIAGCLVILITSDSLLVQIFNIFAFTFFRIQAGFFGHDLSHNQVFKAKGKNRALGYIMWGFISGVSQDYWMDKHDKHHENTNQNGQDPDIDLPFLFSKDQAHADNWFLKKFVFPFQHILFFVSLPFVYFTWIYRSYVYIFQKRSLRSLYEAMLMAASLSIIITLWMYSQGFILGAVMIVVHFILAGMYMSSVFAPNHIGKDIIPSSETYTRLHQIITSRNLRPSFLSHMIFGGLDYQIEHHLYPTMPRKNYRLVGPMVKKYCLENDIPYDETSWVGSMKEIYKHFKNNRG